MEYLRIRVGICSLSKIYSTPKIVTKDGEMRVLYKRLESFFEKERDINRIV